MNEGLSKFKGALTWPEFRVVWVLIAIIAAAFAVDVVMVTSVYLLIVEAALLLAALVLLTSTVYRAAQAERDTKIVRIELANILENSSDAIVVYEADFRVLFFNAAAERFFQLHAASIIGHVFKPQDIEQQGWRTLMQVIFPSLAPRVIARSKEGEYPQVADISFSNPDFELRVATVPLKDENGTVFAFMKTIANRTAVIAAMRSKSEFVTVASHQLRNPVTDITWALESLTSAPELAAGTKDIVENALAASHGLLRRIEDLLNIAKIEEGGFGYHFEESDVMDFLSKVLTDVLPAAKKAGVKLYFDRPSHDLPHVMIDAKQLSLALVNLLENAIRYNIENGTITVKADQVAGKPFVAVSVKDTGIGIPPEDVPKLFAKFYRAQNAMKLQTEGSGIGLYIAKSIVNAHGGEIWVESEYGRGTTITFTVPTDPNLIPKHEALASYLL